MIKRAVVLSVLFGAVGAGILARPAKSADPFNEKIMEQVYPHTIGDYHMLPSADNPEQTYKMDENSYRALDPFGIVSRHFDNGVRRLDAVVIASSRNDSFHNPLACFAAQDWKVGQTKVGSFQSKTRGTVNYTITHAIHAGSDNDQIAIYFYEGPSGMYPANVNLHTDLFWSQLKTGREQVGAFYRFISLTPNFPEKELVDFAASYLDASPLCNKIGSK